MNPPLLLALDLMDTVVQDPFYIEIPKLLGRPLNQVAALLRPGAWVEFETGKLDEATYLQKMYRPNLE